MRTEVAVSIALAIFGFGIGVFQKWLDGGAVNELPALFQRLDISNFFGRLGIWILIAAAISVYSATPVRASVNAFVFLISMIAGYYIYCKTVLGFLPVSYMLIWVAISFASIFLAYICWYAKGEGLPAVIISAGILGVLFSQACLITQGFYMTHITEVIVWVIGLIMLRRKPKEFALEIGLSLIVAFVYQLVIPYWG